MKLQEVSVLASKINGGLNKLLEAEEKVEILKVQLRESNIELRRQQRVTEDMLADIAVKTATAQAKVGGKCRELLLSFSCQSDGRLCFQCSQMPCLSFLDVAPCASTVVFGCFGTLVHVFFCVCVCVGISYVSCHIAGLNAHCGIPLFGVSPCRKRKCEQ